MTEITAAEVDDEQFTPLDLNDRSTWAKSKSYSVFKTGWDAAMAEVAANGAALPTRNLEQLEKRAMTEALEIHHGNRTHAAKELGCDVRTLQRGAV